MCLDFYSWTQSSHQDMIKVSAYINLLKEFKKGILIAVTVRLNSETFAKTRVRPIVRSMYIYNFEEHINVHCGMRDSGLVYISIIVVVYDEQDDRIERAVGQSEPRVHLLRP